MITIHGEFHHLSKAFELGVGDYLVKPSALIPGEPKTEQFVGRTEATNKLRSKLNLFKTQDHPILISGDSGTGKKLVATLLSHSGLNSDSILIDYPDTIRPAIHSVGVLPRSRLGGVYLIILRNRILWFADTTINIDPSVEELSDIAIQTTQFASQFMVDVPRIAMLSFSNCSYGDSSRHGYSRPIERIINSFME
jgi:hypothetical protein